MKTNPANGTEAVTNTKGTARIIEVEDLVKVYGGKSGEAVRAVDGISFHVNQGEFFGFLGPNGAGKTTTIRIIATLLGRTTGSIRVSGLDVVTDGAAVRRLIGYAGQSIGVDDDLTGRENLRLMGRLYHLDRRMVDRRVEELLTVLGLQDAADRRAATYSGGMRRRLDLGSGLVHHPKLLILDEPTTGLDPQTRNAVWDYLRRLNREKGMTIFLTTQYMEEADRLCGRICIIDHGKIVAEGSPEKLKSEIGADVVTVRLERDGAFAASQARALKVVSKMPGVRKVTPFDQGVSVHAEDGGAALIHIVRLLDAKKVPLREISMARPSLDEVFLARTGRELRTEEARPANHFRRGRRR